MRHDYITTARQKTAERTEPSLRFFLEFPDYVSQPCYFELATAKFESSKVQYETLSQLENKYFLN